MASGSWNAVLSYVRRLREPAGEEDGELLRRFAAGRDQEAFAALVRRHGGLVWAVCNRLLPCAPDAEDAFQATFLVLARKAGAVRRPELLGPWLHGVARRTAAKLRAAAARRQAREREAAGDPAVETTPDVVWRDLRPVLDEEVGRLPERLRLPFILCHLEGVSNEEAARRLGCPKGTVLSRLSRARERLRHSLTRRGITLSGALLAAAVAENATAAAAPAVLVDSTVRLGAAFVAGTAAAPAVSLAEGVLQAMWVTKLKVVAAFALALGVVGSGTGLAALRGRAGESTQAQGGGGSPPGKAPPPAGDKGKPQAIAEASPVTAVGALELNKALSRAVRFKGIPDPKTTLADALEVLSQEIGIPLEVNERAFEVVNRPGFHRDTVVGTLPPMNGPPRVLLQRLLSRLPLDVGATYVVRDGVIEITPVQVIREELGVEDRPLLPLVFEEFEEVPLREALRRLSDASGFNVVLDPRAVNGAGGKSLADMPVSARLRNVPVDTAARLLASMVDLRMVRLDNVLYITTQNKADELRPPPSIGVEATPAVATKPGDPAKIDKPKP
jgi:RNA polymerase sigma factor (sigma-70 family)